MSAAIKVRSTRVKRAGRSTGGQNISLKRFDDERVQALQKEIRIIKGCMEKHPLTHPEGNKFNTITRIFNNCSLNQGGRNYSNYQNYSESERLTMTIDGEPVCEIDIKSCYLAIIAGRCGISLEQDPYSVLPYVKKHSGNCEDYTRARKLMKLMVSKLLSVDRQPTNFPEGERVKMQDGTIKTLPVQEKYQVPKKVSAKSLFAEIYQTYPFLKTFELGVFDLMYIESNVMTATIFS